MSSHVVYEFRPMGVRSAAAGSRSYLVPGSVVSICDSPAYARQVKSELMSELIDSDPDGLNCARGLGWAFVLEIGMALAAYGIWHLWHLAH